MWGLVLSPGLTPTTRPTRPPWSPLPSNLTCYHPPTRYFAHFTFGDDWWWQKRLVFKLWLRSVLLKCRHTTLLSSDLIKVMIQVLNVFKTDFAFHTLFFYFHEHIFSFRFRGCIICTFLSYVILFFIHFLFLIFSLVVSSCWWSWLSCSTAADPINLFLGQSISSPAFWSISSPTL